MKTLRPAIVVAAAVIALTLGVVTTAHASPTRPATCSNCHPRNTAVVVTAVQTANDGVSATFEITVNNPYGNAGWAIFSGTTKYVGDSTVHESVMLPVGQTYTVWGVSSGTGDGSNSVQITAEGPAAPKEPTDPAPPPVADPDPGENPPPSTEASPAVETGTLKIHVKRHCSKQCCSLTVTSLETSETTSYSLKRGCVVIKDLAYGSYEVTAKTCKKSVTKTVVVDKPKAKVTLDLGKHCGRHHKGRHHHGKGGCKAK